ncbi:nck-associated protein 5-like isoform X3 [Denticeps clupeoides]|uniref:nck-associated protein 5-like isoform X3 n=1 Tax=Denticeps clupeoides TaxID=299321 RepID=UPI0010A373DF|nr:nck-associated protein 5-like isoform X3 [Denticeps clupeoides]XP_028836201.1 nck-associated protein 5-like isoform X3 [Denticeps clupeoides]
MQQLLDRLEKENSALAWENENQREQYEHCLDENLHEKCMKLRTRVFDLEQQNHSLGVLFQQKLWPLASDLLLQELIGRGLPMVKCSSLLSLCSSQGHVFGHSSCSSSEISISSPCSDFSSGSYTWTDPCSKLFSQTLEKSSGLASSTPSNMCTILDEQLLTRRKECRILEGLKKLQLRHPKQSSKSDCIDCMHSNEGIYSLGMKPREPCAHQPTHTAMSSERGGGCNRKFVYDLDEADDEWFQGQLFYSKKLSHSIADSLCSWEGWKGDGSIPYDPKEMPEKLTGDDVPKKSMTTALLPTVLHLESDCSVHVLDTNDLSDPQSHHYTKDKNTGQISKQPRNKAKCLSVETDKMFPLQSWSPVS